LFDCDFEVFDDFPGEDVRIEKIVGFFEAFVSEPEDVEAGFVALMRLIKSKKVLRSEFLTAR
jgi:hypothetical protein